MVWAGRRNKSGWYYAMKRCVFWRGTSATIFLLKDQGNFDVREGDRGGSCRFQSPSLFLFQAFGWHGLTGPLPKD